MRMPILSLLAISLLCGGCRPSGGPGGPGGPGTPGPARAVIDLDSVENTSAWAAEAAARFKAGGDAAQIEKEAKDALLGKKVRWTFPVEAVDEGEVKVDTFFGAADGTFRGEDPKLNGRPQRRLHLRIYFGNGDDAVKVGHDVTAAEAAGLRKGSRQTVARTVTEVSLTKGKDDKWFSASHYGEVVDVLGPCCLTVMIARK